MEFAAFQLDQINKKLGRLVELLEQGVKLPSSGCQTGTTQRAPFAIGWPE